MLRATAKQQLATDNLQPTNLLFNHIPVNSYETPIEVEQKWIKSHTAVRRSEKLKNMAWSGRRKAVILTISQPEYHQSTHWGANTSFCGPTWKISQVYKDWQDCPACHHPHWSALARTQRIYCWVQWGHPLSSYGSDPNQSLALELGKLQSY